MDKDQIKWEILSEYYRMRDYALPTMWERFRKFGEAFSIEKEDLLEHYNQQDFIKGDVLKRLLDDFEKACTNGH